MGERLRWVVSVDEDTQALADRWQEQFSPLVGSNRSSLVRLVFKTLDRLGMTAANVLAALNQPQGLTGAIAEQAVAQCHNSSQLSKEVASPEVTTPTKPPVRVAARRGRPFAAIRFQAAGVELGKAWLPPFSFHSLTGRAA